MTQHDQMWVHVGEIVSATMEEKGMSVEALARECEVSRPTLFKLRNGKRSNWSNLEAACGPLGLVFSEVVLEASFKVLDGLEAAQGDA